jgi:hypothetical protein
VSDIQEVSVTGGENIDLRHELEKSKAESESRILNLETKIATMGLKRKNLEVETQKLMETQALQTQEIEKWSNMAKDYKKVIEDLK